MKKIFLLSILLNLAGILAAQVSFTASAPNVVETGERFRLTYTVDTKGGKFSAPNLADFQILSGPNQSSSSSISIVNGNMQQSYTISYTYILQANKVGKFIVDPAGITVDKKNYKSNALTIEVVKGAGTSSNSSQSRNQNQTQNNNSASEKLSDDDLFIKIHLSKTSPYVGEPIVATFKFYSKKPIYNISDATLPKYSGFYSQDLSTSEHIETKTENVNGQKYTTGVVQQVLLIPQKSGEITIDPASLEFIMIKQVRPTHFFDDGRRKYSARVESNKATLNVKPLPANKPVGFTGAVGKYSFSVTADKTNVKANDAITIKATISGTGNLKLVDVPKLQFPPDFEVYDPKVSENLKTTGSGITGSKTYEYLVIPRHQGTFSLPAAAFSYFDTKSKQYKTLSSEKIDFTIDKGDSEEQINIVQGYSKEDIQFLGKDIKFIETGVFSVEQPSYYFCSTLYYSLLVGPFVLLILIIALRYKQIKENSNIARVKNKKANKVSLKRLKSAQKHMQENNDTAFYEEVMRALWGYLSDKLTIPVSELTKDNVAEKLRSHEIDEDDIQNFIDTLNQCEFARFAPSANEGAKEHLFDKAKNMITMFEGKLK